MIISAPPHRTELDRSFVTQEPTSPHAVVFPFVGSDLGGSHISCFTLAVSLRAEHGITSIFLCPRDTLIAKEAERRGFNVVDSGDPPVSRHNLGYDAAQFRRRYKLLTILCNRRTIIHFNDLAALQSWVMVAKYRGHPIVYHHRSLNKMTMLRRLVLVLMVDHIICISNACARNIKFFPCKSRTTLMNPFYAVNNTDRGQERKDILASLQLTPPETKLVGYVANFWHRKRPFFFLDVAKEMARASPPLHFLIFGRKGDYTSDALKSYASKIGIFDRVTFAGFRLPAERNIAALDILLAPALAEPFGRTLVEAILVGTPFVASADGGHVEILESWGGGLAVPADASPNEFARVALNILLQPDEARLSEVGRRRVQEIVSPERHAQAVLQIYRRLVEMPGSRG